MAHPEPGREATCRFRVPDESEEGTVWEEHLTRLGAHMGSADNKKRNWDSLSQDERESLELLARRTLHVQVDRANLAYGHGIARTNDFGFQEGENMCRHVPMDVRAHLRQLQTDPRERDVGA